MADDKIPTRQARAELPAHPNESLRTTPKGCLESIRNRKGVNDNLDLAMPIPKANANESALEFAPEIGNLTEPPEPDASLLVEAEVEQMFQLMSAGPVHIAGGMRLSAMPPGEVRVLEPVDPARVSADFAELQTALSNMPLTAGASDLAKLATIQTDPMKRPFHERFPTNATPAIIKTVMRNRIKRFEGVRSSAAMREAIRLEFVQMFHELMDLGIVKRPR